MLAQLGQNWPGHQLSDFWIAFFAITDDCKKNLLKLTTMYQCFNTPSTSRFESVVLNGVLRPLRTAGSCWKWKKFIPEERGHKYIRLYIIIICTPDSTYIHTNSMVFFLPKRNQTEWNWVCGQTWDRTSTSHRHGGRVALQQSHPSHRRVTAWPRFTRWWNQRRVPC